jgi:cytosine/adenosine deaminase-related metal-dependent hydrolase
MRRSSSKKVEDQDAVRRMTSLPASILGLRDRGVLRKGASADVVGTTSSNAGTDSAISRDSTKEMRPRKAFGEVLSTRTSRSGSRSGSGLK